MTHTVDVAPRQLPELAAELSLAVDLARRAGAMLLEYREGPLTVETKVSASDPVSEADRASEAFIVEALRRAYPSDAVLGEEGTRVAGDAGRTWVIDPLDGTVNYLYGRDAFAVSIALETASGAGVGVVFQPSTGRMFAAASGGGASVNGHDLRLRHPESLNDCLLVTGFSYESDKRTEQAHTLVDLLGVVRDIRREGSAALDLASVAAGESDICYERYVRPWDIAAGAVLVREAGGVARVWESAPGYVGIIAGHPDRVAEIGVLLGD
jgi:myo-inositol-1(or 4)-monophosphatase